jgi:hypothetical protein
MTAAYLARPLSREEAWAWGPRADERLAFETAACWRRLGERTWRIGLVTDMSPGGLRLDLAEPNTLHLDDAVELRVPLVGDATARVVHIGDDFLGLSFDAMDDETRERLSRLLFSRRVYGMNNVAGLSR